MTAGRTNTPNPCLQDLNTIMFHREAIITFPFPFASQCNDLCCYIAILAFTAFTWGKWDRQGIPGCLREKPWEAPGLLKIAPVYIKEFLFLLLLIPPALKTQAHPQRVWLSVVSPSSFLDLHLQCVRRAIWQLAEEFTHLHLLLSGTALLVLPVILQLSCKRVFESKN